MSAAEADGAGAAEELIVRVSGRAGRITLNRPKALNAVTHGMVLGISAALDAWEGDGGVDVVVIDAAPGRAFAAGGDIRDLYDRGRAGDFAYGRRFWADEYRMNARLGAWPKPVVTLVDGIVMGGGVGVASHAAHRVATERTVLAMPECGIGLIPDVGGSKLLADAPGRLGEFMGLTGTRVGAVDAIRAGFADRAVPSDRLQDLIAALEAGGGRDDIARAVEASAVEPAALPDLAVPPLDPVQAPDADAAFSADTPQAILGRLDALEADWATEAAAAMRRAAPLSLACALLAIRAARGDDRLEESLAREYRFAWRCSEEGEFLEGIRAAIIDRDRTPRWAIPRPEDVTPERAEAMLAPLGEDELRL